MISLKARELCLPLPLEAKENDAFNERSTSVVSEAIIALFGVLVSLHPEEGASRYVSVYLLRSLVLQNEDFLLLF